jgi:hypothetical protein
MSLSLELKMYFPESINRRRKDNTKSNEQIYIIQNKWQWLINHFFKAKKNTTSSSILTSHHNIWLITVYLYHNLIRRSWPLSLICIHLFNQWLSPRNLRVRFYDHGEVYSIITLCDRNFHWVTDACSVFTWYSSLLHHPK